MTDTAPDPTPEPMPPASPDPRPPEDLAAVPVATATPAADPQPEIEWHAETGTVFLHYRTPGLDAPAVTRLARAQGADVIGAPDHLGLADGTDHWSIQIAATGKETV